MSSLGRYLDDMRASGRKLLVPFFTAGYPDMQTFQQLLRAAADGGADAIEIGLPFSDPLADGPAIQLSSSTALRQGTSIASTLDAVQEIRDELHVPLIVMTYVNPVLAYGPAAFAQRAEAAGIGGMIFPDLPLGEEGNVGAALATNGIDLIRLVAPTTPTERLARIAQSAEGFIYLVSVAGVTGSRDSLPADLHQLVARVRVASDLPVLIGFGISTAVQAAQAAALADGVIVGSVLVNRIHDSQGSADALRAVGETLLKMRGALDELKIQAATGVRS